MGLKKMFSVFMMTAVVTLSGSITALAAPETMPDGNVFDAEYYAANNQDVAAVLGTDKVVLYNHYINFGQFEGRLPYDPAYTGTITVAAPKPVINTPRTATTGDKNALSKAKSYLRFMAFSYEGLVEQLKYEGFSDSEARYGAEYCGANWNAQALDKALSYLKYMAFSEKGLVEQLEYEGFTHEQALYGVANCKANWNEQAAKKAASYLKYMGFSRSGLIEQLEYEGFSHDQAVYGVSMNGY